MYTSRKPAIIRGKNWIKGEKVRVEGGGKLVIVALFRSYILNVIPQKVPLGNY